MHHWPVVWVNPGNRNTHDGLYTPSLDSRTHHRKNGIDGEALWKIRDDLITDAFDASNTWLSFDILWFAKAAWWKTTQNNIHLVFARLQDNTNLVEGGDYTKNSEEYLISPISWADKVITYMTELLNQKHWVLMARVQNNAHKSIN